MNSRKNIRLQQLTHRKGFNTRDNPQDIDSDSCQSLVNMMPGDPAPIPRLGTGVWSSSELPGNADTIWAWDDSTNPAVIVLSGGSLYYCRRGGLMQILRLGAFTTPNVHFTRIKEFGILNSNYSGENYRIWVDPDTLAFRIENANIRNSLGAFGFGSTSIPLTPGNIANGRVRGYSMTFIRREDPDGIDGSGNPLRVEFDNGGLWNAGIVESSFDSETFYTGYTHSGGSGNSPYVYFNLISGTLDPQVTHVRIYCSQETSTLTEAAGFEKHWRADIPVRGVYADFTSGFLVCAFTDTATPESIVASLNLLKMVGYSDLPPAKFAKYYQGLLWIGGGGSNEEIGRFYYSELPLDLESPIKWAVMFKPSVYFKDCSYIDTEEGVGLGISQNDLIMFLPKSVWYLRDGDPAYEPILIDAQKGTQFPLTITQVNKDLYYLSRLGPAVVLGRQIEMLVSHTAGEVWPMLHDGTIGYFHLLNIDSRAYSFFKNESWFIGTGDHLIGFYIPSHGRSIGSWKVEFADQRIAYSVACAFESGNVVLSGIAVGSTNRTLWHFMPDNNTKQDNGLDIWLKCRYKASQINPDAPDQFGEAKELFMLMRYGDDSPPFYTIISDFTRKQVEFQYNQSNSHELLPTERNERHRDLLKQPIPEGLIGRSFEVEYRKIHKNPFQFEDKGWILEARPIRWADEFLSKDGGDNLIEHHPNVLLHLKFDENRDMAQDFSTFGHDHLWVPNGSRTWEELDVPGGGQNLIGSTYSGYVAADAWQAMDGIGDGPGGLNSNAAYNWRGIFYPVIIGSGIVVHQGGDGTNYWRLQINADGSLEFRIRTSGMQRRYVSPAGSVSTGAWFFIIFQLSNYGQNGQFYGGQRTGNFQVMATSQLTF